MDLEQSAFEALRFASAQSLKLYKQPLVITYSGGKDSDVLLWLAENSGIPFEVLHSLTTADAPETVYHVRDTFRRMEEKGVKCVIDAHVQPDGKRVTMWNLIPKKPKDYMRICFAMIDVADEVWMMPRWAASEGAAIEWRYCRYICKDYRLMSLMRWFKPWEKGGTDNGAIDKLE